MIKKKYVDALYQSYGSRLFETTTFVLFFLTILGYFHLYSDLDQMIYGPHYWRQSDGIAQTMNYAKNGLNFFDHSLYYNQFNGSAKAVGEFPIMYYLVAAQHKLFGGDILTLLRWNYLILGFFGLMALFKICQYFIKDLFISIGLTFILFTSPVFAFYFLASMPDPVAFNLSLIGFWLLLKYFYQRRPRFLVFGIAILSVAFMVKIYFMIPYLALIGVIVINRLFKIDKYCFLPFRWVMLSPIAVGLAWIYYMTWYNGQHTCNCFLDSFVPFWSADANIKAIVIKSLLIYKWHYVAKFVWYLLIISFVFNMLNWQRKYRLHNIYLIVSLAGSVIFFLLFYIMFADHDYYVYPLIFLLPLSIGFSMVKLKKMLKRKSAKFQVSFLLLMLVLFGIQSAIPAYNQRKLDPNFNNEINYHNYAGAECLMQESGISENDLIVSLSDVTPNYSLYLLNRKGWSGYQGYYLKWGINDMIDNGANYLVINERCRLWDTDTHSIGFKDHLIASENEIYVYDLRPYRDP